MAQAVQLPDGSYFPIKQGERPQDAYRAAMQLYPDAFETKQAQPEAHPEGGFFPALKSAYSAVKSEGAGLLGRSGLMDLAEAEKYIEEQKKYQADTFKGTTKSWSEDPITHVKELIGGSLPYMVAPALAGAAVAGGVALAPEAAAAAGLAELLPSAGLGAAARYGLTSAGSRLATGLAGATSAAQFTGSNLSRQQDEDKSLGETDLLSAALAAIPQAALDTFSLHMMPGLGKMFERAGLNLGKEEVKNFAEEGLKKTAADYLLKTGKVMGIEGLTEAGQQVFERAQAGLSITDPEARQEYFDNFVGGAVLGGVIAPAGRYVERGQAQTRYDMGEAAKQQQAQQEQLKLDALAAAEEEKKKSSPEYFQTLSAEYKAAEKAKNDLKAQLRKVVAGSETETADRLHNTEITAQIKEMSPGLQALAAEYNRLQKIQPKEEVAAMPTNQVALAVGDTLDNPLGNFTKEELASRAPTVAKYIDNVRKKAGKPALETYSIEDIRNAMPNQLPEAEQADLSSLIAAKSGHTGEITYKPTDVLEVAKQKNIDTTTEGFKDFLRRATGDAELEQLTQPQLHSAFTALSSLPRFDEPQILPQKRNATDYSKEQYGKAVAALQKLVEDRKLGGTEVVKEGEKPIAKPVSIEEANQVIKAKTGLKNDADVQTLLREANRNGDIDFKGNEVTYQPRGAQAEFNIEEGFAPAEGTGFNVMRDGKMLFATNDEAEATAKAEKLGKDAPSAIQQIDKSINKENATIADSQKVLDAMEAEGKFNTPQYTQAAARHAGVVDKAKKTIANLTSKKQMLQKPVTVQKAGKSTNRKIFTVKEKGVEEKAFNTREEAEKHALENLPEERLNELATQTKALGFANRLKKEQERRKKPVLALPAPKPPAPKGPSAEASALHAKLLPMLRRFGLGDVALKVEDAMRDEGSYGASVIKIALDASNPFGVLRHEAIHGLKDLGFFTPGQWKVLENKADKEWVNTYLKQRNVDGGTLKAGEQSRFDAYMKEYNNDEDKVREEAIADAFRDFDVNGAPKGLFAQLLNAMRKFFRALRSALTGAGYETAEDIFGKVERGELKATKAAEAEEKKSLIRKAVKDESEISTQNPQAKNRLYDPLTDMLSIDEAAVRESMAQNPELEKNMIDAIKSYGFIPVDTKDEDVIKVFKDNIVNNLLHLYSRVPEDVRQRSKLWYDGANRIAIELGARYNMSKEQVSGILAAMSPQKDWFQNVSMAERAIEILTNNGDATWTPQMMEYARSYINEAEDRKDREKRQIFFDKRISEMNRRQVKLKDMSVKDAAAFVRAYDEAFHDRKYRIVTPEGGFGGFVMNKNVDKETGVAKPATMMWSTYSPIEKTVSIFRNPSRENISQQLGQEHKIRSFYNNIVAPNSPIGHVTIDTHAVAAGLYEALAGSDPEVLDNFGDVGKNTKLGVGGTYGLIADAYREAAKQVGLKPREMQSITWEAVRGMFPENIKNQIKKPIRAEWNKYRTGEQSFDETRQNIEALGERADRPDWFTSGEGEFVDDGGSSFDISFTPEGGVRLRKEKELVDKAIVNLSAVTKSIPGLDVLHTRALNGDTEAYSVLQNVAASTLKHLLSGTNARVTTSGVKGVYESDREPAIVAQVRFKESDTQAVLAALAKFAENFNQEQIHVRTKTAYKAGHDFGDGTYATPVYTVKLKNELTEQDIVDIVNNAGLKGFSVSANELTAYHVQGKQDDTAEYEEFLDKLERIYETYGEADGRLRRETQRLAVYGRGDSARLGYADISGIVRPKQDSDKATPRIIGEYLTRHPIKAFEQKALTKAQTQEQTVLKDVFQVLPKNDLKKPLVRKAYEALAKEVKRQYETLPIKVVLTDPQFDENGKYVDIYKNSAEMRKDVSLNNTFKVLKTDASTFGPEGVDFTGHPLLGDSGLKDINGKTMLYNDLLRAVHDYFAHNLSDTEFGPKGEFAAWKNHMATTTDPLARWALTNETRAQNAWQNFRAEVKNLTLKERGFADQKASLPPVAFTLTGDEDVDAPMLQYIGTLNDKQKLGSLPEKSPLVNKLPSLPEAPTTRASLRTAPQTAEFKRWFGNSKVVDADGNPKVMYHGTARDITAFKPKQAGAIFLTDDPYFADIFAGDSLEWMAKHADQFLTENQLKKGKALAIAAVRKDYGTKIDGKYIIDNIKSNVYKHTAPEGQEYLRNAYKGMLPSGPNIMPVYVRAENPFDYANPDHIRAIEAESTYGLPVNEIITGKWQTLETRRIQELIKAAGFDGFYVAEAGRKNLAVYDPAQIKSATGNEGTYDINNPDIRKSLRTNVKNDISSMPNGAAILATMNRVTPPRETKGFAERITRALAPEASSYFRQQAIDRYDRLSDYDKLIAKQMGGIDLLADQSAHWAALHSDNAAGVTASALGIGDRMGGVPVLKNGYFTVSNLNGTVKGLVEIIAPLARHGDPDIYRSYQLWSAAKRGTRLNREGRFELMTPQEIKDALTLEQKYPEFVDVQKEWIKFNNGLVKMQVDAGVITKEAGQEFMKYSDYLPLYRQMDGESTLGPSIYQSISGVKAPKKLTGKGTGPIEDYLETIVRNTQAAIQASMKNVAAKKAVENGMMLGMVVKLPAVSSSPDTITILENGKKVSYQCADKLWVEAVSSLNLPELPFLSILAKPADMLRALVTKDPGFMLANMMRDSVSAYVTSGANINPVVSTVKNYGAAMMNRSPVYQALLNAGALGGYEFSRNVEAGADALAHDLRKKTGTETGSEKLFKPFTGVWNFLERGTEASDAATRMAVYEATMKETGNEAEAIRRAVEVMNFNRKGRSAVVRIAAAAIPFLNARIQGLDVFFRAGIRPFYDQNATAYEKQIQKAMLIRGATLMALSTMYAAAVMGDPDYEKQEQETKDNFWLIPSLGIKLPIPFEVGTLFKTVPERIYRYYYGADTSKDLSDSMKRALQSTFAFNPVPQAVAPLMEARDNYSVFTQRPIVGEAMRNIAPEFQVGPSTTKFAEWLGKQTGTSPILIDHVYKGYTGTMGMYLADVMDAVYSAGSDNPKASQRFEQTPVLKRFLLDPEARGQVSAYYDLKHSVDQTVRTINLLEKQASPDLEGYINENISMLGARKYVSSVDKQMQKLSAQAAMIRSTPMPADEKRKMLDEITKIQNELTNEVQLMRKMARP